MKITIDIVINIADVGPYLVLKNTTLNSPYKNPVRKKIILTGIKTFIGEYKVAIFKRIIKKRDPSRKSLILLLPMRFGAMMGIYFKLNPPRTIANVIVVGYENVLGSK